jgi:hypothetical protein
MIEDKHFWQGPLDFQGTIDTAWALKATADKHPVVWEPILKAAEQYENIISIH